jgi:hypothetical protein
LSFRPLFDSESDSDDGTSISFVLSNTFIFLQHDPSPYLFWCITSDSSTATIISLILSNPPVAAAAAAPAAAVVAQVQSNASLYSL